MCVPESPWGPRAVHRRAAVLDKMGSGTSAGPEDGAGLTHIQGEGSGSWPPLALRGDSRSPCPVPSSPALRVFKLRMD